MFSDLTEQHSSSRQSSEKLKTKVSIKNLRKKDVRKIKKRWVNQPPNSSFRQRKDHILSAPLVHSCRHIFMSPSEKNGFLSSCLLLHSLFVSVFLSGTSRQVREKARVLIGSSPAGTHRHLPCPVCLSANTIVRALAKSWIHR